MDVGVVAQYDQLAEIRQDWDALVERASSDGLFLTWDWVTAWWRCYGKPLGAKLHVVTFRNASGALVGLAPLYLIGSGTRNTGSMGRLIHGTTLRFLGSGADTSPDYLNVLALPGLEKDVATALAKHLTGKHRPGWEAMLLTDMLEDAIMTETLYRSLTREFDARAIVRRIPDSVCPYVALAPSAEIHSATISRKLRHNIRARRRKLEEEYASRFYLWDDGNTVSDAMEHLARLHRKRFKAKGERHSFSTPEYVAFHKEVAQQFLRLERLRLYCLEARGQIVAMLYCFRYGDRIYHFQSGFDPDWSSAGVGQVLISYAVEHAIGEGARRFDFLKGEYAYKSDWATGRRRTVRLTAGRTASLHGMLHLYETLVRPTLGRIARVIIQ